MVRKSRPPTLPYPTMEYLLEYETIGDKTPTRKQRWCRCCVIAGIIILVVALLIFLGIFVLIPVVFMHSIDFQRTLVFETWNIPENQNYSNFRRHGIDGVRNFYIVANGNQTRRLGVWHILPLEYVYNAVEDDNYNYERTLRSSPYPVILYFHGTEGDRITNRNMYRVLRRFFHVIAFDYRAYGDSTQGELSEEAVIEDGISMYKWLRTQTNSKIYVWGYSLGTGISTHVVSRLRREGIIPMGLFLESPFTNFIEEVRYFSLAKYFYWLPWYNATIADPLNKNGFRFNTIENMLSVDCPVLIVHAEDDNIVPYMLGKKLSQITRGWRTEAQGNVTFYSFPSHYGFGHKKIYEATELPDYIRAHIDICKEYNKGRG